MSAPGRGRVGTFAALAAFLVFLALRAWPLDYGSPPLACHPDEAHYPAIAARLTWSDLDPHYFENPPLFTYALFLVKEGVRLVHGDAATAAWIERGNLYLAARGLAALIGALTPFVAGAAAFALFRSQALRWATILLVGLSFLHGRDSHYGVNDVPMTLCVAGTLLFAARGLRGSGRRDLVLAAACAGFAAATKYNGAVAFALAPLALLLRDWPRRRERGLAAIARDVALLAVVPFVTFLAGNPYALLDVSGFSAGFLNQFSGWGDRRIWAQSPQPLVWQYLLACRAMLGTAALLAVPAGLVIAARRDRPAALLLLAFPVLYLAGMLSKDLFFWRFALPLLPFMAVFAALALAELARWLGARVLHGRLGPALAGVMLATTAEPASSLVRHDVLLTRPGTWMQARQFAYSLPKGAVLFLEGLPPSFGPEHLSFVLQYRPEDLLRLNDSRPGRRGPALKSGSPCYLFTCSMVEQGWALDADASERQRYAEHYSKLRRLIQPIAEFAPGEHGDAEPFVLDALYSPLTDLWSIDRPGFTIRVYPLDPGLYERELQQKTVWKPVHR